MLRLLLTPVAQQDLDEIWDYIARDSLIAADKIIDQLRQRFVLLTENPLLGELQPHLADGTYRRFAYRSYVIYYRPQKEELVLIRVLHGSRDEQQLI